MDASPLFCDNVIFLSPRNFFFFFFEKNYFLCFVTSLHQYSQIFSDGILLNTKFDSIFINSNFYYGFFFFIYFLIFSEFNPSASVVKIANNHYFLSFRPFGIWLMNKSLWTKFIAKIMTKLWLFYIDIWYLLWIAH